MSFDFRSDNTHGCSPEILDALTRAAAGTMTSYGSDEVTARVRERCREIFETDVAVFPVLTGTAANSLAIAAMTPPWGVVFCHEDAHVHRDELGAPEFFSGGAKLMPIAGKDGKLHADDVARVFEIPSCVSITQATEAGTVYTHDEIRAVCDAARARGARIHMDGARFANALVTLGCAAADLTWRTGVDVLSLGATKNGALAAELIVAFRKDLADGIAPRWHRAGHRLSKMRFLSAQLEAYLADDVWLRNARHANAAAARIARGIEGAVEILRPVEANVIFVRLSPEVATSLQEEGFLFYDWPIFGEGAFRIVTAFDTTDEEADALIAAIKPKHLIR